MQLKTTIYFYIVAGMTKNKRLTTPHVSEEQNKNSPNSDNGNVMEHNYSGKQVWNFLKM